MHVMYKAMLLHDRMLFFDGLSSDFCYTPVLRLTIKFKCILIFLKPDVKYH